jgi:hypothetical protein
VIACRPQFGGDEGGTVRERQLTAATTAPGPSVHRNSAAPSGGQTRGSTRVSHWCHEVVAARTLVLLSGRPSGGAELHAELAGLRCPAVRFRLEGERRGGGSHDRHCRTHAQHAPPEKSSSRLPTPGPSTRRPASLICTTRPLSRMGLRSRGARQGVLHRAVAAAAEAVPA